MTRTPMRHDQTALNTDVREKAAMLAERYRPSWDFPSIIVLEESTDLSAALAAELAARDSRMEKPGSASGSNRGLQCRSAASAADVLKLLTTSRVLAIVVDLNSRSRESLVLLQHLLSSGAFPAVIAVGTEQHQELTGVLLEAGCQALIADLPYDTVLADWIGRVVRAADT